MKNLPSHQKNSTKQDDKAELLLARRSVLARSTFVFVFMYEDIIGNMVAFSDNKNMER